MDVCLEGEAPDRLARPAPPPPRAAVAAPPPPVDVQAVQRARAEAAAATGLADARALAAAAPDLTALFAAARAADLGPDGLKPGRAALYRGPATPALVVVALAATADDEEAEAPGSGRPGALLDRMLAAAGLTGRAGVANLVFRRPPGDAPPSPAALALHRPVFDRLLELTRPQAVLALGEGAGRRLTGASESLMKLRGRWFEASPEGLAQPVLITFAPALLLNTPAAKAHAWADLLRLTARLDRGGRPL